MNASRFYKQKETLFYPYNAALVSTGHTKIPKKENPSSVLSTPYFPETGEKIEKQTKSQASS